MITNFPPQDISLKSLTADSCTITWSFPPSCFERTGLWVLVNGESDKRAVHEDATEFAITGLEPDTQYQIYMVTDYGEQSAKSNEAPFKFTTAEQPALTAGAIAGIAIGFIIIALLIVLIIIFCLWKRGVIFQKEGTPVNKQLHRVSRAINTVRRTVRRGAFTNNAYTVEEDDIYMYPAVAFSTRQPWQLDDSSLTLMDHMEEGKFASIYKASWRHEEKEDIVAAKMLKAGFTEDDALKMMAKINFSATQLEDHDNVVRFIGAVTDNQGWGPVLVMEYCELGQMDKWLAARRSQVTEQIMENLFRFAVGIAKGMEYLASKKVTHSRLAARNILLTFTLDPKVAGFGPQQKRGDEEKATKVPAKWAAPEVLEEKPPTEKSDVWSYGIVLWEIFSMGEVPYPTIHINDVGLRIKSGYRMDKPEFSDDTHFDVMKDCWQFKQSKRPTFGTIRARLTQQYGNRQSVDLYYDSKQLGDFD
ncbi:tyrosine-protein kinase CSK-like [Littorina saxatilis]|uniref:tyrosine-protein kinase CSK-like n=1 Tax=Littorina saxatilis TaxID=31220 RepID=UPI0038B65C73